MKKKLLIILLSLALSTTACGAAQSSGDGTSSVEATDSLSQAVQDEINSISDNYDVQDVTKSLDSLCQYLEDSGLVSGNRIEMAGEMLGAISGVKYTACNVEIYEYDTDSEKYKSLISTGKVTLEGFNIEITPSAVYEEYILICDDAPNKDEIIAAFNNMN